MLTRTFLHLHGIGEATERKLWAHGIGTWEAFLAACAGGTLPLPALAHAADEVAESLAHYRQQDWAYFDARLPLVHRWRAFEELGAQALYVDIETTGLGGAAEITVIGCYDGREARAFIAGRDLEEAADLIAAHPLVITYNGAQFDMPLIRAHFPGRRFNHVHIDLRYPLRRLGLRGGLKHIEQAVGLARSARTTGLDGWDAVRLWYEYRRGDAAALETLVAYNREDIVHLAPLMARVQRELGDGGDTTERPAGPRALPF